MLPTTLPSLISHLRARPLYPTLTLALLFIIYLGTLSNSQHPSRSAISLDSALPSFDSPSLHLPGWLPSGGPDLSLSPPGSGQPVHRKASLTAAQAKRYKHLRRVRIPGVDNDARFNSDSAGSRSGAGSGAGVKGPKGVIKQNEGKYLFVTLTRNIESQLPDLLNTLSVLVSFLGPSRCRFSILEGPSDDRTADILTDELIPMLHYFGVHPDDIVLRTNSPPVEWDNVHRIEKLAELRNEALSPLWKRGWDDTAAVVYFNDVYLRARDVLELLHQHVTAGEKDGREVGVTSGMDWYQKTPEYYYDIWVGRTVSLFFPLCRSD